MAKQKGEHPFTGKMGATIGYKANGEYLERENGNKEGKSFRRDPKRARTMACAYAFGGVSKGLKFFYRALPKGQRQHGAFGALTGRATKLMRAGKTLEEVLALFRQWYVEEGQLVLVEKKEEVGAGSEAGVRGSGGAGVANPAGEAQGSGGGAAAAVAGVAGGSSAVSVASSAGGVAPQPFYVIARVPTPTYWRSM